MKFLCSFGPAEKFSKEVSLFEPIGVDRDGETVSLVDILGDGQQGNAGHHDFQAGREGDCTQPFESCLTDTERNGGGNALRPLPGEGAHPAGDRRYAREYRAPM